MSEKNMMAFMAIPLVIMEQWNILTLHLYMLVWIKGTLSPEEIHQKILQPDSQFRKSLIEYLEGAHSGDFITGSKDDVEDNKPPAKTCKCESNKCEPCNQSKTWWAIFKQTVDDLLLKSNVQSCTSNRNNDGSQNKTRSFTGCLDNIYIKFSARFPRQPVQTSYIDEETGHIHLVKRVHSLNTFTYIVTYLFYCNTDVTSLKSGTAIRGVLLYLYSYI